MIELQDVGYTQGGVAILSRVNWSVGAGDHWAVLGPNGSGKTTLLRVACGYQWPTSGRVLRNGREFTDLTVLRRRTGWVGEELLARVPREQTALQITASGAVGQIGLRLIGQVDPTEHDYARAAALLDESGCGGVVGSPFRVLSQGERQKVLIARARMTNPVLLVLDEPCAGMDPGARERFLAWLQELLADSGSPAVMLVTHHVEEVMPAVKQTLVIEQGSVAAAGPTERVLSKDLLARLYGVGVDRVERAGGRLWPIWS